MRSASTRILCIPDTHAPYHDKRAVALALKVTEHYQPHHIVILGDFVDCYSISDYPKDPTREGRLKREVAAGAQLITQFRKAASAAQLHYLEGNHEERLGRYLAKRAPELHGLVSMRELLEVKPHEWHAYGEELAIGKCHFVHDVGYCGQDAARKTLAAFGGNIVFGHAHRADIAYDGNLRGERHFAICSGWLGDGSKIDYAKRPRVRSWQHGVTLVNQDAAGRSWGQFVPFVNSKCVVQGREIAL